MPLTSQMFPNGAPVFSATATAVCAPYRFAKQTTTAHEDYKVEHAGADELTLGITIAKAKLGEPIGVCIGNVGALEVNAEGVGNAIAAGDFLKSGANGVGVIAGEGDYYGAIALEPATTDAALIRVLIVKGLVLPDIPPGG